MPIGGYVQVDRDLQESPIWRDPFLVHLFLWCKFNANFKAGNHLGQPVGIGQFITGRLAGSKELRCTPSRFTRGLERLESCGLIAINSNNRWTTVTVCGYEAYAGNAPPDISDSDNGWKTDGKRMRTIEEQQEHKERKEGNRNNIEIPEFSLEHPKTGKGPKAFRRPSLDEVSGYCVEMGFSFDPSEFWDYHEAKGWKVGSAAMKDWRAAVRTWDRNNKKWGRDRAVAPGAGSDVGIKSVDELEWFYPDLDDDLGRTALQRWIDHLWDSFKFRYRDDLQLLFAMKEHACFRSDQFSHDVGRAIVAVRKVIYHDDRFQGLPVWVNRPGDMETLNADMSARLFPWMGPHCPDRIRNHILGNGAPTNGLSETAATA